MHLLDYVWRKICDSKNLIFTLDLGQIGIGVYSKEGGSTEKHVLPL